MEEQWSVRCVNQLALVDAYYDGRLRIRASTVHPPVAPFFANAESGGDSCKARKKRKRQQEQLADLIARGKFVPLDDHVVTQLQRASSKAKQWAFEGSSAVCSAEEALVVPSSTSDVPVDDFTNDSDDLLFIKRYDQVCVMPRHSRFIKGDVRDVVRPRVLGSFELITMDPPWENKSVDRKRCYTTFQHKELLKLPMPELASTQDAGCVLGIWVTNRPLYTTFILDELLPYWGFDYQDTWYWLKVCATGALVSPLTSPHRLPVEKLIVATRTPSPEARVRLQARLGRTPRVVVSVPLRHSWKPPPESFFGHMSGRKLELFARELRPHWVSIGNEPLKFQELRHFNAMPESNRLQGPRNQGDLVASTMGTRTTPTRRRQRGNGVLESWADERQEAPQMQEPPMRETTAMLREDKAREAPQRMEPSSASASELQSVAKGLLQQLDRIHAEQERAMELRGVEDVHLAHDFRTTCAELIQRFPGLALSKGIDQLLWNAWHRELVALEGRVASARNPSERSIGSADEVGTAEMKLRDALYVALRDYCTLIQEVKSTRRNLRASDAAVSEASTIPLLVHRLLLSHSHILYSLEIHSGKTEKNWRLPELNYDLARKWRVEQGEPHNHLARVVLHGGRCSEALYHLVRARTAEQPWETSASLADQFTQLSGLRYDAPEDDRASDADAKWILLDKAVLSALEPFFGRAQEFVAHRRAPRELSSALGVLLGEICSDTSAWTPESENNASIFAVRLVRIVSLVIACACLPMDFVVALNAAEATASVQGSSLSMVSSQRAVELLAAMLNCLLHRSLAAITSPLSVPEFKQQALQLMLPAINIGFAWLRKHAWREMVSEATRSHCEQLTTMLLTAIIAGGFMSPQEDPSLLLHSASPVALAEEIEVCGFKCLQVVDDSVALASVDAVDADPLCAAASDSELLRRRIERFFTHVEVFMAPRLPTPAGPPGDTPVVQHHRPEALRSTDNKTSSRIAQASVSDVAQTRVSATLSAEPAASTNPSPRVESVGQSPAVKPAERVVVLDAANIAMRHGLHRRFSCRGIQLCADYFLAQGDRVVAFLPDYCLEMDGDGFSRRRGRRRERSSITPDDQELLKTMVNSGVVVPTPAMDSDDLYCIHYARRHNAFLVTNDLFRDHVSDTDGPRARQVELRQWLESRRISYTWVGDEFLPNPTSAYEKLRLHQEVA